MFWKPFWNSEVGMNAVLVDQLFHSEKRALLFGVTLENEVKLKDIFCWDLTNLAKILRKKSRKRSPPFSRLPNFVLGVPLLGKRRQMVICFVNLSQVQKQNEMDRSKTERLVRAPFIIPK